MHARCNAMDVMRKAMVSFSQQDSFDQKIRQLIVRSRLEIFKAILPIGVALNTCVLLNYIVRNRLWAELVRSWHGTPPEVDVAQLRTPVLLVLALRQFLAVLFLAYPRVVNPACIRSGIALVYVRFAFEAYIQNETDFPAWGWLVRGTLAPWDQRHARRALDGHMPECSAPCGNLLLLHSAQSGTSLSIFLSVVSCGGRHVWHRLRAPCAIQSCAGS